MLITGMIVSLIYFLVLVFYRGSFSIRIMYIFTLYTFAAVLVARIAIEQSRSVAIGYMAILGVAAFYVLSMFATINGPLASISPIINAGLLGLIAFLADRITFDCTFVDERARSSGEGLMQSLGWVHSTMHVRDDARTDREQIEEAKKANKPGHNPGVWILYFSVIALPVFGFGQVFIPGSDTSARRFAFWCLLAYLFCSLSLLVLVSLLGLRRYMRQRDLEMNDAITFRWIGIGVASVAGLLAIGLILPLSSQSIFQLDSPITFNSPDGLQSRQLGWGKEGTEDQEPTSSKTPGQTKDRNDEPSNATKPGATERGGQEGQANNGEPGANAADGGKQPKGSSDPKTKSPDQQADQSGDKSSSQTSNEKDSTKKAGNNSADQPSNKAGMDGSPRDKAPEQGDNQNSASDESRKEGQSDDGQSKADSNRGDRSDSDVAKDPATENQVNKSQSDSASQTSPSSPASNNAISVQWMSMLKWLIIVCLVAVVIFYFLTHPSETRKLLQGFREFLSAIFRGRRVAEPNAKIASVSVVANVEKRRKQFREYRDPFHSGIRVSPVEAIRTTFEAFEAWAYEHSVSRIENETPSEFVDRVKKRVDPSEQTMESFARAYNQLAYAGEKPSDATLQPLRELWEMMRREMKGPPSN